MDSPQFDPGVLVIEDIRIFRFPAVYARNLNDARTLLLSRPWREVWWDFDLGLTRDADTSYPLAVHLERLAFEGTILPIERTFVHSANPVGGDNLMVALKAYKPTRVDANDYLAAGQSKLFYVVNGETWE